MIEHSVRSAQPVPANVGRGYFGPATYAATIVGVSVSLLFLYFEETGPALYVLVLLAGCLEVHGFCGASHVAAITSYQALRPGTMLWLRAAAAYTSGGLVTAPLVGSAIGAIGAVLWVDSYRTYYTSGLAALALVLAARELAWVRFNLPQVHRQTERQWAREFGIVPAAAMWGAHIGLAVATVVKHGGFYIVVGLALVSGPVEGAMLFVTYWLGRTVPIWVGPLLVTDPARNILQDVFADQTAYDRMSAMTLLAMVLLLGRTL